MLTAAWLFGAVLGVLVLVGLTAFLLFRDVPAGQIRLVTWLQGSSRIYRGPAKSKELPLLATATTVSNRPVSLDLDVTEQSADADGAGRPRPIEVRVRATAIVAVGDSDAMIRTAANRFYTMSEADQTRTLADLLASATRESLTRLRHDALFSAGTTSGEGGAAVTEHPLAALTREICAARLSDLGLALRAFSIKAVHSEVAEARRREAAAEAKAEAAIASAQHERRAKEAQLEAERVISEKERELEQTRAHNSALIAQSQARQQEIKAKADAERVRIEAEAAKEALRGAQFGLALDEALRITKIAAAQAEGFRKVNDTIREGGDSYFRYRLIEMLPQLTPAIAEALTKATPAGEPLRVPQPAKEGAVPGDNRPIRKRSRASYHDRAEGAAASEPDA
jgi:flotillin